MKYSPRFVLVFVTLLLCFFLVGCPKKNQSPTNVNPQVGTGGNNPTSGNGSVTDSTTFTTGDFDGCPPEGSGSDSQLNRLKNRDKAPPAYNPMTVADVMKLQTSLADTMVKKKREKWDGKALEEIAPYENQGVSIEAYLRDIKQEGKEACNCGSTTHHDYHMWITETPGEDKAQAMVVEISPRLIPANPNWAMRILSRLAKQNAKVRISGWLMYDQEHPEQVGKTRGTLWEVHPIHKIEVFTGGSWRDVNEGS